MTVMRIQIPAKKTEMFTWVVSGLQDSRVEFEAKYDEEEKEWCVANSDSELIGWPDDGGIRFADNDEEKAHAERVAEKE